MAPRLAWPITGTFHGGPMHITAIKAVGRDANRVSVCVNNRKVAILSIRTVAQLGLTVGQSWDDAMAARVREAAVEDHATHAALSLLNRRAMSTRQIEDRLRRRGYPDQVTGRVSDRLTSLGILDDRSLGQAVISAAAARQPAGPSLLRSKLLRLGLEPELVDELLAQSKSTPDQMVAAASRLARQKLAAMTRRQPPPEPHVVRRRLWALLSRRGFDADTVEAAVHQVIAAD